MPGRGGPRTGGAARGGLGAGGLDVAGLDIGGLDIGGLDVGGGEARRAGSSGCSARAGSGGVEGANQLSIGAQPVRPTHAATTSSASLMRRLSMEA